jgi:TonB-dependent SusC/RagA subfamily outer membrane receptor
MPMKRIKIIPVLFITACLTTLLGFARFDDDVIKAVAAKLNSWSQKNLPEKVYLHLDKPYYAIGDDIWFKAYITTGAMHQLSNISKILNVELIDDRDSIQKAIKLPVTSGLAWGDFKLTDSLKEGNYRIRAYTNWMRNAGDEYYFDKTIQIGNSINNTVFVKTAYTYITQNNEAKTNAVINYANFSGSPYAGKEVTYQVKVNDRQIAKGKGITDATGNLELSFLSNTQAPVKGGNIVTNIRLDVKQPAITKIVPLKAISNKVDVQFFPEGGYLVNNLRSKVAFKAVGADGLGVDIKGAVFDNENTKVANIETSHLGMGVFSVIPEPGKTYTAKITYPDGSEGTLTLPAATDKGYILSVRNSNTNDIEVKIGLGQSTYQENQNTELNLVAQAGGSIVYAGKTKLESAMFTCHIPRERFPGGIVQFTLFSAKGEPLNERIMFIEDPALLNVKISTAKTSYAPREKVKLNIEVKNKDDKPVTGVLSISVTDESKVPVDESNESTILSNILLTSDIKGYIEKPNYYFTNISDKTRADLDILMLTQGYRRFTWKQVLADNQPPLVFQAEKSLNITGQIKNLFGKPVAHGKVTLLSTTGSFYVLDTVADEKGHFAFNNLVFTDSIKFVVQARTAKDRKNVEIDLDKIPSQLVSKNKNTGDIEINVNSSMAPYLQNSKTQYNDFLKYGIVTKTKVLKEVSISDKKEPVLKHSDNLNGPGNADQVVKSDRLNSCSTLTQCLFGIINFVTFRNGKAYSSRSPNTPMTIVVDGVNMDDDFLDQLSPGDVESIEVLRSAINTAIYGSRGSGGVLVVTTRRGDDPDYHGQMYSPGVITYRPMGYYRARQFYSPRYDDPKTNASIADLRTTIYWNPSFITDKTGNASVEYFNADSPATYRAVIEGIDIDGNLVHQVYRYKVQ